MKRKLCAGMLVLSTTVAFSPARQDLPVQKLWPGGAPSESTSIGPEQTVPPRPKQSKVVRITNVSEPTLTWHVPKSGKSTTAVVVAPGGGYSILAWDLEGLEVAEWFNSIGVTAAVLKYRVPRRADQAKDKPPIHPLQDAQRSIRLTRSRASELGIDPKRIGMLGFSAGGNLTVRTCTMFADSSYATVDEADKLSARPDFGILIYPAYLSPNDKVELNSGIVVPKDVPPMFFAHAIDDSYGPENSMALFFELKKLKTPSELHVYSGGGHGFGLRPSTKTSAKWPVHCEAWLRANGWLNAPP